jgi:hypothetical protein
MSSRSYHSRRQQHSCSSSCRRVRNMLLLVHLLVLLLALLGLSYPGYDQARVNLSWRQV